MLITGLKIHGGSSSLTPTGSMPAFDHASRARLLATATHLNSPLKNEVVRLLGAHFDIQLALNLFNANPLNPEDSGVDLRTGESIGESRRNIGIHCVKVALGVERIVNPMVRAGILTKDEAERAIRAALGHDCLKGLEIDRRNDAIARGADLATAYSQAAYDTEASVLKNAQVEPELLRSFISFGSNTGHRSIAKFLDINSDGQIIGVKTDDMSGLIAHVVDSLTYSTKPVFGEDGIDVFVPAEERMLLSKFNHAGEPGIKPQGYPFLWTEGLGVIDGGIVEVKDIQNPEDGVRVLGSYAYLQTVSARAGAEVVLALVGWGYSKFPDVELCNYLNEPRAT